MECTTVILKEVPLCRFVCPRLQHKPVPLNIEFFRFSALLRICQFNERVTTNVTTDSTFSVFRVSLPKFLRLNYLQLRTYGILRPWLLTFAERVLQLSSRHF
ncbi:hypothetical protein L596_001787 [Steinernema carpocapsae]|uniref:Uncharacterized protein n=1 Tax=Steinernema carpocapsae TaxID=34508 RepID=A0A4U8UPZ0_STECR|nr:hypothetical protein L596_001787 [Steinernema carpocapsae]